MRITFIAEENRVNVEGFSHTVDLSELIDGGVHVIQWYGDRGEIEYWQNGPTLRMNEAVTDFSPYQKFVDAWEVEARKEESVENAA